MTNYEGIKMEADGDNIRFALLKSGKRMLYVFGVNPSTATESRSDSTMRKVIGFHLVIYVKLLMDKLKLWSLQNI